MAKTDFTLKFIKNAGDLRRLSEALTTLPAFALDIETSEWWNRHRERIALIQIAFRTASTGIGKSSDGAIKVVIVDPLAGLDLEALRQPFEHSAVVKIIHNAGFDAPRLSKHYNFSPGPVFDTMLAARRSGERKYSLKAQAEIHLKLRLDKSAQTSDWSRRPLDLRQLNYAALDPFAALLLYENQIKRGLSGKYQLKTPADSIQNLLPLGDRPPPVEISDARAESINDDFSPKSGLSEEAIALLGIITELPTRYSPDSLAVSIESETRVGLAGWIIDRRLGTDAEPDEAAVKLAITGLCDRGLVRITETRRLEATETGERLWLSLK